MSRAPALLILLLGLPAPLVGQAVFTGRITGDSTKQPIPGVQVVLEAVEVYASDGETPAELTGGGSGSCGTVVLWTRRGR